MLARILALFLVVTSLSAAAQEQPVSTEGRLLLFKERAWKVERTGLAAKLGFPARFQTISVVDGKSRALDASEVAAGTGDEALRKAYRDALPPGWVGPVLTVVALTMLVVPPVLAVVGLVVGAVVGGVLGVLLVRSLDQGALPGAQELAPPVGLGVAFGALAGAAAAANAILPVGFLTTSALSPAANRAVDEKVFRRVVTEHNRALARELALNPAALDDAYFPADG